LSFWKKKNADADDDALILLYSREEEGRVFVVYKKKAYVLCAYNHTYLMICSILDTPTSIIRDIYNKKTDYISK